MHCAFGGGAERHFRQEERLHVLLEDVKGLEKGWGSEIIQGRGNIKNKARRRFGVDELGLQSSELADGCALN